MSVASTDFASTDFSTDFAADACNDFRACASHTHAPHTMSRSRVSSRFMFDPSAFEWSVYAFGLPLRNTTTARETDCRQLTYSSPPSFVGPPPSGAGALSAGGGVVSSSRLQISYKSG